MSLPEFPGRGGQGDSSQPIHVDTPSAGAGNHLPIWLLALCGAFTAVATAVSVMSMTLQLKNYRKPSLQRAVVRIMVMVPLYAISSLIALFSLEAAFFIDAVRDLYEAFVIYTFLQLLITYLGGERSLLIILHGRPPIPHPFPFNLFLNPMDVSDPWTLLNLKRGVLQYVQIKPLLVVATVILKVTGTYKEGKFAADSGYTYISIVYNTSICLSLYCLAMFWVCVSDDLKPFRPLPKFLCVKGILFFSFWQSIAISFLVAVKAIKKVGPYTDAEHMSLALVDSLICFEMPLFAIAHQYAFQASDYIDHSLLYAARLPFIYALRDAFGLKDVWEDTKDTLKGRGVSYQAYEPAEGGLHHGLGRQKRIRAGLRYSKGGSIKYWIPMPGDENKTKGNTGPISAIKRRIDARLTAREGYAPLLPEQSAKIVHGDPDERDQEGEGNGVNRVQWGGVYGLNGSHGGDDTSDDSDAASLDFDSVDDDEDNLYERARRIGYAGFPNVDVSREEKIRRLRQEEEEIMSGKTKKTTRRSANKGKSKGLPRSQSDGRVNRKGAGKGKGKDKQSAHGVYGAWADKITQISDSSSDEDTAKPQHATSNGSGSRSKSRSRDAVDGVPDGDQGLSSAQIKWTKTNISKNLKPPSITHRWSNPDAPSKPSPFFSLGEDEDGEDDQHDDSKTRSRNGALTPTGRPLPPDARDLVVDDPQAVDEAKARERRRGEPQTKAPTHVYVHQTQNNAPSSPSEVGEVGEGNDEEREGVDIEEVYSPGATDGTKLSDNIKQGEMPGGDPIKQLERIEERVTRPTPPAHLGNFADENNPWA